jgi:hypothetical protein
MATRRVSGRSVRKRTNANTTVVTRAPRGVRRLSKGVVGQPNVGLLQPGTNRYRGIRTLMKRAPADGLAQSEARQAMLTSQAVVPGGVRVNGGARAGATIRSKAKITAPIAGLTKVRPPRLGPLQRRSNGT